MQTFELTQVKATHGVCENNTAQTHLSTFILSRKEYTRHNGKCNSLPHLLLLCWHNADPYPCSTKLLICRVRYTSLKISSQFVKLFRIIFSSDWKQQLLRLWSCAAQVNWIRWYQSCLVRYLLDATHMIWFQPNRTKSGVTLPFNKAPMEDTCLAPIATLSNTRLMLIWNPLKSWAYFLVRFILNYILYTSSGRIEKLYVELRGS